MVYISAFPLARSFFLQLLLSAVIFSFYLLIPKDLFAAAGDEIAPGQMTLSATYESVGIELPFTLDNNKTATASVQFKKSGSSVWKEALPLWRTQNGAERNFFGSILFLEDNTDYDVKVTVIDADGGGTELNDTIKTKHDSIPTAADLWQNTPTNLKYYVRENGSDSNDGTSEQTAWKSIDKALRNAPSGAVVQFGPGYFPTTTYIRTLPITLIAQYPALDDAANPINSTQRTVIERTGVSSPTNATDGPNPGVWQQVNLTGPLTGQQYTVWKWENSPLSSVNNLGYASTRADAPHRVAFWEKDSSHLSSPAGWAEKLYTNLSYNYGFYSAGKDIYLRLPINAPSSNPNDLYITTGCPCYGFRFDASNTRVSGMELRGQHIGIGFNPGTSNHIVDHNLIVGAREYIRFISRDSDMAVVSDSLIESNRFEDHNLWTDDHTNKPAIPWDFIKDKIKNSDGSTYSNDGIGAVNGGTGLSAYSFEDGANKSGSRNTVFRKNVIDGPFNGLSASRGTRNIDIHDNILRHIADDGLEPEGNIINFRGWDNRLEHTTTFLSTGPANYGPIYLVRNQAWATGNTGAGRFNDGSIIAAGRGFKYSGTSNPPARVYVVNNTIWTDETTPNKLTGGSQSASNGSSPEDFWFRNNILRVTNYAFEAPCGSNRWNEDYNHFVTTNTNAGYQCGITYKVDLNLYRTNTGMGTNTNVNGNFITASVVDNALINPAAGNLALSGTTFKDQGVVVPNLADCYNDSAPDLGAIESNGTTSCSTLETGLVGYWQMDESSWTNDCLTTSVTDSSTTSKNGVSCPNSTGVTSLSTGKFGNAPDFDSANNQHVQIPSPGLPTDDFTYSAWFNSENATDDLLMMSAGNGNADELMVFINAQDVLVRLNNVTVAQTTSNPITASTWTHIALTRQNGTVNLYINGTLADSGTENSTLDFGSCPLLIGVDADGSGCTTSLGNYFDGKIDEVRVYNRGLSAGEVLDLYNFVP